MLVCGNLVFCDWCVIYVFVRIVEMKKFGGENCWVFVLSVVVFIRL